MVLFTQFYLSEDFLQKFKGTQSEDLLICKQDFHVVVFMVVLRLSRLNNCNTQYFMSSYFYV